MEPRWKVKRPGLNLRPRVTLAPQLYHFNPFQGLAPHSPDPGDIPDLLAHDNHPAPILSVCLSVWLAVLPLSQVLSWSSSLLAILTAPNSTWA